MCNKCINGVDLENATHLVMSNNENQAVDMFEMVTGVDEKMADFRTEHEDAGDVIITLCACENGANGLVATIKGNFNQLN